MDRNKVHDILVVASAGEKLHDRDFSIAYMGVCESFRLAIVDHPKAKDPTSAVMFEHSMELARKTGVAGAVSLLERAIKLVRGAEVPT